MIWATIRAAIYLGLGVAEVAGDVYSAGKKLARKLKRASRRPPRPAIPPPPKGDRKP